MLRVLKYHFCKKSKFDEMLKKLNIKIDGDGGKRVEIPKQVDFNEFQTVHNYFDYFGRNRESLVESPEQYFLFLDNLSSFIYNHNDNLHDKVLNEIVNLYSDTLGQVEYLYFISFIESLTKLEYYDNKTWIVVESIILKSNIVKMVDMRFYYIILKGFRHFYRVNDTTISAEDVFEIIEYNTIIKLKELKEVVLQHKDDLRLLDLFILFAFNLEGSDEMYSLMVDKILLPNRKVLAKLDTNYLVNLYTSSLLVNKHITKGINGFISELKSIIDKRNLNTIDRVEKDFLQWCNYKTINNKI
jgi:hypothetical protein